MEGTKEREKQKRGRRRISEMHDECNVVHVDTRNVGLKRLIMQAHCKPRIVYFSLIFLFEISTFAHHNT